MGDDDMPHLGSREMKTAEEVAKEMLPQLKWFVENNENGYPYLLRSLTAYADERVKEALCDENPEIKEYVDVARSEGYAQGIEDAAKVIVFAKCLKDCDSYGHEDLCPVANPEKAIRALAKK